MAKDYFGVKQDKKSGKWKYSIKKRGNKRASWQKYELDSAEKAALYREMHILRERLDTNEKGNKLNLSDKEFKRLKKEVAKSTGKIFGKKKVKKKKK